MGPFVRRAIVRPGSRAARRWERDRRPSPDRLRELGGRLLRNSRPYQVLLERIAELAKRDAPSP